MRTSNSEADPTRGVGLGSRLAALPTMTRAELRAEWCRLYRSHPPHKISRDLLELGIAWKLQEAALGGLGAWDRRQLAELASTMAGDGKPKRKRAVTLRPGARLVREWHGETHDVLVLDKGLSWRGRRWGSLSAIAREITGARWSGPRFFGLQHSPPAGENGAPTKRSRPEPSSDTHE